MSGGWDAALPSSHTDWRSQCPAPLFVLSRPLPPPQDPPGSWMQRARPRLASRGRCPCPIGEVGDGAGCCPTSSLRPGHPRPSAWLCLPAPGRASGCPSSGVVGSCYSVPNPLGHRAIYLDVGPAHPRPPPCSPRQEKPHFTPHLPTPSLQPGVVSGVGSRGQVTPRPPRPLGTKALRGLAPVRSPDPVGHISVEAPQQDGLGARSFSFPAFLILFMFLFTNWSGVLHGARAVLPNPRVSPGEGFGSSPSAELASTFPHPTKDHTVK